MRRAGLALWSVLLVCVLTVIGLKAVSGLRLETDILALLPEAEERFEWQAEVRSTMQERASGRVVAMLSHADSDIAVAAAATLTDTLLEAGLILPKAENSEQWNDLGAVYFPFRLGLLSDDTRAMLLAGEGENVADLALAQIYAPFGLAETGQLQDDPYLLFANHIAELIGHGPDAINSGGFDVVRQDDQANVIVNLELAGNSFASDFQARFVSHFEQASKALSVVHPELVIKRAGAVFYADQAMREARYEATSIGLISIIAIVLLTLAVFRGVQPILLALLAIGAGLLAGAAAVLAIFESLHLMALVFGAALVGVSVDYAFHYCCQRFANVDAPRRALTIAPGLSLGVASSIIGFLTMTFAPFDGLRQVAVFSATGLGMSFLTVLVVFPLLDRSRQRQLPDGMRSLANGVSHFWRQRRLRWALTAIVAMLLAAGFAHLRVSDDIRQLQSLPAEMREEEKDIALLSGRDQAAQFFLVVADSEEQALIAEETLRGKLDGLVVQGALAGYVALSQLVPSIARQTENRALVEEQLFGDRLIDYRESLGLEVAGYGNHATGFLTLEMIVDRVGEALAALRQVTDDGQHVHLVALQSVRDPAALAALARGSVHYVDPAEGISTVLAQYRVRALLLLAVAGGLVWGFLSIRYGPHCSLHLIAAPTVAVLLTPCLLAMLDEPFTFFNAMGLLLVFALGLDYALFCAESDAEQFPISLLANCMSALSTILAFGLLAFSQQYAVHAFGQTILVGVAVAFCLAPMSRQSIREAGHAAKTIET